MREHHRETVQYRESKNKQIEQKELNLKNQLRNQIDKGYKIEFLLDSE